MKDVIIFGATGSIGKNALDIIRSNKKIFNVKALCTNVNIAVLKKQVDEFNPKYVCVADPVQADKFKDVLKKGVKFFYGLSGLKEFCSLESDISVMAISGIAAMEPLLAHIPHTKRIALANKEAIITGGKFIFNKAKKYKTEILPVDSEINALYQLFKSDGKVERVYLTASGGALFDYSKPRVAKITAKQVLSHPTWKMGRRITVDSATLVNKGFEVVETNRFFNIEYKNIHVVIHRESVVHAMCEYADNTIFACMYPPDMRLPIGYALFYPQARMTVKGIDFSKRFSLSFQPVSFEQFPLLELVIKAGSEDNNKLTVLNAADEIVIDYFLKGKVEFKSITKILFDIYNMCPAYMLKSVSDVYKWDTWGRGKTMELLDKLC
ncbi:MAG: 1-deoxy-D-xylulose-5-phosphate reductoisomerase [Candidatus Omnitrophica bacterium]|nr:1-deoxy-D-xylulose-5-phosphate reductoisomerase [Candidatus Omnitrophota bacterium]